MLSLVILHKYTCIYLSILPIVFSYTRVYNISINKQRTAPQIAGSAASDRTVGTSQGRMVKEGRIEMMVYMLNDVSKIEVTAAENGFYVTYYENMGGRWVRLGDPEKWSNLADIMYEYDL